MTECGERTFPAPPREVVKAVLHLRDKPVRVVGANARTLRFSLEQPIASLPAGEKLLADLEPTSEGTRLRMRAVRADLDHRTQTQVAQFLDRWHDAVVAQPRGVRTA